MNIVVICIDTFRSDLISRPDVRTPNLQMLKQESADFSNAFGESGPTIQMRRGLATGMRSFPWRFELDKRGVTPTLYGWHRIPPEQPTMAELLVERGYATGFVTDTHHMFKPTMNFTRGFTSWEFIRGQEHDNYKIGNPANVDLTPYTTKNPDDRQTHWALLQYLYNVQGRQGEDDYFCARVFRRAAEWVEENRDNGPFFLWVDSFDPHEPWDPPRRYADSYYSNPAVKDFISPGLAGPVFSEEIKNRIKALYFGEVTFVDEQIGRFLGKMRDSGLLDDTIVALLTDHGTELWDIDRVGKSNRRLQWFNTKLNLMLRHPEAAYQGLQVDAFVQNHDLMPTLLSLVGIDCPPVDGCNLWPLVTGEKKKIRDFIIDGWGTSALVRDNDYSYMRQCIEPNEWNSMLGSFDSDERLLYELHQDPGETANTIDQHPNVEEMMVDRLQRFLGGPLPYSPAEQSPADDYALKAFLAARSASEEQA